MSGFFKFPSTVHLVAPENYNVRTDKVMSGADVEAFLSSPLIVEEKIDGANLGLSFDASGELRAQNRGGYVTLPGGGQWKTLDTWLAPRIDLLFDHLSDRYVLFGEWCYAKHSVAYEKLPDWFIGFDIYDRSAARFLSCSRRDAIFKDLGIAAVPRLAHGRITLDGLRALFGKSSYGAGPAEGLYLRVDDEDWLVQRAKLVRPAFVQAIEEHWSRSAILTNRMDGSRARS